MNELDKKLIEYTLINITEDYSKSRSTNQTYIGASKLISARICEIGCYNFDLLLSWLKDMENAWYRGKWKAVKRFVYMMDDIYHNRDFPADSRYVYYNSQSKYLLLPLESRKLIDDFCQYCRQYRSDITEFKNCAAYFLFYLHDHKVDLNTLTYEDIYDFVKNDSKNHASMPVFDKLISTVGRFLDFCYLKGCTRNMLLSFLLDKRVIRYYEYLSGFPLKTDVHDLNLDINDFCSKIEDFRSYLFKYDYSSSTLKHIEFSIKQYALFADMFNINICKESILYWTENILINLIKSYKSCRTMVCRYYDYLNDEINLFKVYSVKPLNYVSKCPAWARKYADEYLAYRIRSGLKNNTVCMDRNSILRFVLFLDNTGVKDYSKISQDHLFKFKNEDTHSTVEGKNAYITRIRQFLVYLHDKGVVSLRCDSKLFRSFRLPQKTVSIIDDEILKSVYNSQDIFKTELELRSYCLFLLGVRLGLRATDVVSLKKSDFSFKKMSITFVQTKTQKQLELPVPVMVANSIYRYLKSIRSDNKNKYLFTTLYPPYRKPSRSACNRAVSLVFEKLGIDQGSVTFHTLRRTYASNIVKNSHTSGDADFALGHSNSSAVDKYLSLDKKNMKLCCLDIRHIPYGGFPL